MGFSPPQSPFISDYGHVKAISPLTPRSFVKEETCLLQHTPEVCSLVPRERWTHTLLFQVQRYASTSASRVVDMATCYCTLVNEPCALRQSSSVPAAEEAPPTLSG